MKIGKYELKIINSGYFWLDGGAMFGIIPKPLWEKTNLPDSANRIKLSTRNLLLLNGNRKILIDSGMGNKWDAKSRSIYSINQDEFSLDNELVKAGISAGEITDVIITHLHFDHTGGSIKLENGKLIPSFPNAKYYVQKKNFEWAVNPSERDRGSYIKENFVPLFEAGLLNLIDNNIDFDDEIEFLVVNGHTFSQQLVKISDSSSTILYCGDLIPTSSHIPIPYVMGYDLQPLVAVAEKKSILSQANEEQWKLFFEHDPEFALATIKRTDKGFQVDEKFREL
ncbi:MAG TPA: MBL fold metallo-hydrolase [Ignavibacteriaceae bacterium]|nr:MBL fold metallo-hydrolase [Ignavibacteriaceae bacterium]